VSSLCKIAQAEVSHFVKKRDFIAIHAGILPFTQNAQKED